MINVNEIEEHMEVVGADGEHVGTVDKIEGQHIKLTKSDPAANGQHHFIDIGLVDGVEDGLVRLTLPADEAKEQWADDPKATFGSI